MISRPANKRDTNNQKPLFSDGVVAYYMKAYKDSSYQSISNSLSSNKRNQISVKILKFLNQQLQNYSLQLVIISKIKI